MPTRRTLYRAAKLVLFVVVLLAVGRHAVLTWHDLANRGERPLVSVVFLVLAGLIYLIGLSLDGFWFARILDQTPSPPTKSNSIAAYLISHLGKYVPGKALVVVMRVGLIVPHGVRASTATVATFYETIVMMASGGLVAAIGFAFGRFAGVPLNLGPIGTRTVPLVLVALALGGSFFAFSLPPVFLRVTRTITRPFQARGEVVVPGLSPALLAEGLAWTAVGWVFLGLSQFVVLHALGWNPGVPALPAVIASVAIATVGGFVVPISPGGLGVREWVLWTSLSTVITHDRAVVASLVLRLMWVVGEVLAASMLLLWRRAVPHHSGKPDHQPPLDVAP